MNQNTDHNNPRKNAKYLYLKYKGKYLRLKKIIEIYGGAQVEIQEKVKKKSRRSSMPLLPSEIKQDNSFLESGRNSKSQTIASSKGKSIKVTTTNQPSKNAQTSTTTNDAVKEKNVQRESDRKSSKPSEIIPRGSVENSTTINDAVVETTDGTRGSIQEKTAQPTENIELTRESKQTSLNPQEIIKITSPRPSVTNSRNSVITANNEKEISESTRESKQAKPTPTRRNAIVPPRASVSNPTPVVTVDNAKEYGINLETKIKKTYMDRLFTSRNKVRKEKNAQILQRNKIALKKIVGLEDLSPDQKSKLNNLIDKYKEKQHIKTDKENIKSYVEKIIDINAWNEVLDDNINIYINRKKELNVIELKIKSLKSEIEELIKNHESEIKDSTDKRRQKYHDIRATYTERKIEEYKDPTSVNPRANMEDGIKTNEQLIEDIYNDIKDKQTEFNRKIEAKQMEYDTLENEYQLLENKLNIGIKKINYLHKNCIEKNIELLKHNVKNNDIVSLDIKYGKKNGINCFDIPDINKSLKEMEAEYIKEKENYN
jgi:hypothetical protein